MLQTRVKHLKTEGAQCTLDLTRCQSSFNMSSLTKSGAHLVVLHFLITSVCVSTNLFQQEGNDVDSTPARVDKDAEGELNFINFIECCFTSKTMSEFKPLCKIKI